MVLFSHVSAATRKSEEDKAIKQHELYFKFEPAKRITYSKPFTTSRESKKRPASPTVLRTSIERLEEAQKLWKAKKPRTCTKLEVIDLSDNIQDAMKVLVDVVTPLPDSSPDSSPLDLSPSSNLSSLPRVLMSPPPTDAILQDEGTGTFMSQTLQHITTFPECINKYKPKSESRKAGRAERGYWRIDTSSWTKQRQVEFWTFLHHFVKNGKAGFGTMCVYGTDDDGSTQDIIGDKLGTIRIYCWGEIHKAVWMMCALGTRGSSWLKGAKWISGVDGKEVILM
jgi:hypothetical protein